MRTHRQYVLTGSVGGVILAEMLAENKQESGSVIPFLVTDWLDTETPVAAPS